MNTYLKSQYHMDPPQNGAPDGALRQLYLRSVDATTLVRGHSSTVTGMC